MKEIRLTLYEINRLLRVRTTWLFLAAIMLAPILLSTDMLGLGNNYYGTMSNVFILLPAKQAAFIGASAALFLTLMELHRMAKYRMNTIIETATNPVGNSLRQTAALILAAALSVFAALCVLLPYTLMTMGSVFKILPFVACWIYIYFGAILITILLASGFYMITRSLDISFIMMGILIVISLFSTRNSSYLLFWVQTTVSYLSDATESILQIDVILYNRLVWLLASSAVYVFGLAGIRRYGKNLFDSILLSLRKVVLPSLAIVLSLSCLFSIFNEPFFDNGPIIKSKRAVDPDTGIIVYNYDEKSFKVDRAQNNAVYFMNNTADIIVDTNKRLVKGEATYTVRNSSGKEQDVPFSISPGLDFLEIYENDVKIDFAKNELDNFAESVYHLKLTADEEATLRIVYEGYPRDSRDYQVRGRGITDKFVFIPYIYPAPKTNTKFRMNCTLSLPQNLMPIMENTALKEVSSKKEGYKTYEYKSNRPLPNWLFAGEYHVEKIYAGGLEIDFVYLKGREKAIKDSGAISVVADVVDFFTEKFGPLDFHDMPFIIAELDVSFVSGGWGLGNMSVFGETLFAGTAYKSPSKQANIEGGSGIGVAVHEIAHQWWGSSPDSVFLEEDGNSPWSSEGLAVYSTYLYMKERYGEEYAKREFVDLWTKNTKKMQNAFYLTHLQYASKLPENDAADIYTAFASTTRYELMPYLLLKAEKLTGGEAVFVASLKNIRQKYRQQRLSYAQFLKELGLTKEGMRID